MSTLPPAFYHDESVVIYHGDAIELMPLLGAVDLVLTDPPYNVGKPYGPASNDNRDPEEYRSWLHGALELAADVTRDGLVWFPGTSNVFDISAVLPQRARALRLLGWHKREFAGDLFKGTGPAISWEPIVWASVAESPFANRVYGTAGRDLLVIDSNRKTGLAHPTPKNIKVMRWLVGLFCPSGGTVLDPFMGSGTTLRAAKDCGVRAIGVEIEERWCEEAVRRLSQEVLA